MKINNRNLQASGRLVSALLLTLASASFSAPVTMGPIPADVFCCCFPAFAEPWAAACDTSCKPHMVGCDVDPDYPSVRPGGCRKVDPTSCQSFSCAMGSKTFELKKYDCTGPHECEVSPGVPGFSCLSTLIPNSEILTVTVENCSGSLCTTGCITLLPCN